MKAKHFYLGVPVIPLFLWPLFMVVVAQLVRALDCGSKGRRFEPGQPPKPRRKVGAFC